MESNSVTMQASFINKA